MDINERAALAAELKESGKCNCAQAVVSVLADQTGMTEQELRAAAAGFCAGMGTMEATCGALIGAVIAAGLATGGAGTLRLARQMMLHFGELCGATACRDLKAETDGVPLCPCGLCVRNAVLAYGKVMDMRE